jgi:molecular chaperone DnaK
MGSQLIGIDLGTTMSAIAHLDAAGRVTVLPNSEGEPLTPSAVYLDGDQAVVGKSAKQAAAHLPEKVATYVKREMGKHGFSRTIDGRQFRPETLSAIILRKLKLDAERKIGPLSEAVITVPAYFDDSRRKATEDAGRLAGFDTVHILNEPTAAALAYCLESQIGQHRDRAQQFPSRQSPSPQFPNPQFPSGKLTALVYDLGGGTFDVTVIRMEGKQVQTLATDGAVKLGGKDWDDRIVNHAADEFARQHGLKIPADRRQGLLNQAETTKKLLSQIPAAEVECFYQDRSIRLPLKRETFESLTRDLLLQTEIVTNLVINQTRCPLSDRPLTWNDIDRVLLVGGSTRMPMVSAMLRRISGKEPDNSLDPDQVVAKGAAIYAAILAAEDQQGRLMLSDELQGDMHGAGIRDVNSHSLGIEVFSPKADKPVNAILIPKNHPLPCAFSRIFPTREAGARVVRVSVMEGEAPDPDANMRLGECVVKLPAGLPAKSPFQVRLSYEKNGRVNVMALDMTGGRFAQAEIERPSGMSEEEILAQREFVGRLKIQ